jgi:hypothetical protein
LWPLGALALWVGCGSDAKPKGACAPADSSCANAGAGAAGESAAGAGTGAGGTAAGGDSGTSLGGEGETGGEPSGGGAGTGVICDSVTFSASATAWSLPAHAEDDPWATLEDADCPVSHALRDMDGDARPDLLVYSDCGDPSIGTSYWNVYANTGTGFATTASQWTLPSSPEGDAWTELEDSGCPIMHALLDIDGDQRPDLVIHADCDDDAVGTDHWNVHLNTGAGFAASASSWALPAPAATDPWTEIEDDECPVGHTLRDMDGDQRPDLLVYYDFACDALTFESDHWQVYLNSGSGFASTATAWVLPPAPLGDPWAALEDRSCPIFHSLLDMDGDARPDLLAYVNCGDGSVGTSYWDVYLSVGTGFADTPTEWTLPATASLDPWNELEDDTCTVAHSLRDMNGDARPDLLVFCDDAAVGSDRWDVYLNEGTAFGPLASSWTLPPAPAEDPWSEVDDVNCPLAHTLEDMNGDGLADLLVYMDCAEASVGEDHWDVFLAQCDDAP